MFVGFEVIEEVGVVRLEFIDLKTYFFSEDSLRLISLDGFSIYSGNGVK
jgi:hypothetical protein